jgi:zinc/manganese transport system substrate-binding protein
MPRLPRFLAAVLALLACTWACASGAGQATPAYPSDANAITVVAGENFYGDLLHQLGGSRLRVYAFLSDPNADPHEYESSSGNARAVADARLVIENGLGYDAFMDKLLKASPNSARQVINVQHLVGAADGANPHIWYHPTVMPRVAEAAAGALVKLDPTRAATYTANLGGVLASLAQVSDRVTALRPLTQGVPVAFTEPVYGYMAEALGLKVLSPEAFMKAVEEGNDPPSAAVAQEQDLLTSHEVKVLLYNSQTVTRITTSVKSTATSNGVPVVGISETEPPSKTYQQWQLDELAQVAAALGSSR